MLLLYINVFIGMSCLSFDELLKEICEELSTDSSLIASILGEGVILIGGTKELCLVLLSSLIVVGILIVASMKAFL